MDLLLSHQPGMKSLGQLKEVEEWIGKEMSKLADGFGTRKPTSTNTIKNYLRQLHKLLTLSEE